MGHHDVAELLLSRGALVDRKDEDGYTALQLAAERGNVQLVRLLTTNNADVSVDGAKYNTPGIPMHIAARHGHFETQKAILEIGGQSIDILDQFQRTMLHIASAIQDEKIVKFLLEKGAQVNCQDINGMTPLHLANCEAWTIVDVVDDDPEELNPNEGCLGVVSALIEHGAEINAVDKKGRTPIICFSEKSQTTFLHIYLFTIAALLRR